MSNFGGTFDQLFIWIFYEIFTEGASLLLLYHGAKKSKMTKNSIKGSCLNAGVDWSEAWLLWRHISKFFAIKMLETSCSTFQRCCSIRSGRKRLLNLTKNRHTCQTTSESRVTVRVCRHPVRGCTTLAHWPVEKQGKKSSLKNLVCYFFFS